MSIGVGYVDGRARRLDSISHPRPIFDPEEWDIVNTDITLTSNSYDPGTWTGLASLDTCQSVRIRVVIKNHLMVETDVAVYN